MINNYNLVRFSKEVYYGPVGNRIDLNRNNIIDSWTPKDFKRNEKEARLWGTEKWRNWESGLTDHEKSSIKKYTKDSWELNNYLWERELDPSKEIEQDFESKARVIDQALAKIKTEQTMIVYERPHLIKFYKSDVDELEELEEKLLEERKFNREVGNYIFDNFINNQVKELHPAFVSTSLSQDPKGLEDLLNRRLLLKIEVPKGTNAAFLSDNLTAYKAENEVLIARNNYFQYKSAFYTIINGREELKINVKLINKT